MGSRWDIIGSGFLTCALLSGGAMAGPWTQEPDDTLAIVSLRYLTTELNEPSDAAFRQPALNIYAEHGLRDAITLGLEAEGAIGIPSGSAVKGAGGARIFVRTRLWQGEKGETIAAEASVGAIAEIGEAAFFQPRFSFLYGQGYENGWYDIASSVRLRGGKVDELHSDATYGYRPSEGWMTYFQINTIQRLDPKPEEDSTTTQFGVFVGYDISPGRTVVVGARRNFFASFAPTAVEASVSLWARF